MKQAAALATDTAEIFFAEGIIGVPRARRFHLLERAGSPVRLLRCLDITGFTLPVVDPCLADPDYHPELGSRVVDALEVQEGQPLLFLAITNLTDNGALANLRAPLVINAARRLGAQVILDKPQYGLQAPVKTD